MVGCIGQAPASTTACSTFWKRSRICVRVVHRLGLAGRDQRGGQQRLAEQRQQLLRHPVVGHAQADRAARRVRHAPRHFLGGFEDEGVRPRRAELQQAVLLVVDARVVGQLATGRGTAASGGACRRRRGCAAAARPRPCRRGGRPAHSSSRWAPRRCRRASQDLRRLLQQARLRVVGVDFEVLGHAPRSTIRVRSVRRVDALLQFAPHRRQPGGQRRQRAEIDAAFAGLMEVAAARREQPVLARRVGVRAAVGRRVARR